jgi:hypothetical protein
MRDIYEVLYHKERELRRIKKEIEVLYTVAPLLQDATDEVVEVHRSAGAAPIIRFHAQGKLGGLTWSSQSRGPE